MAGGVLVLAEARRGELREVSLELLALGRELADSAGLELRAALVDSEPERFVGQLAATGLTEVLLVRAPTAHFEAHVWEQALAAMIEQERPSLVLLGQTIDSLGFAAAVAARLGLGFASDVTGARFIDGALYVTRGAYGEKLIAELAFPDRECTLLTVRAGIFAAATVDGSRPPVREVSLELADASATEHLGFVEVAESDVDITKAEFLLSIGRGVEDAENIPRFERLAERLGATLSVSRPLVDAGWMPAARQVGQSGKTVRPRVYLAMGISGAVQHLAGMRQADLIIAVNSDPEAPIFSVAHYGAVADMFEVADALEALLD